VCEGDDLTTLKCQMSWKSWSLKLLEPFGPHRDCYGDCFTFAFFVIGFQNQISLQSVAKTEMSMTLNYSNTLVKIPGGSTFSVVISKETLSHLLSLPALSLKPLCRKYLVDLSHLDKRNGNSCIFVARP